MPAMTDSEEVQDPVSLFMSLDDWQETPFEQEATQLSESYMLGFVIANIVGVQYYTGVVSGREIVGLVREPWNPFDGNAIRVLNTGSIQVGHIERTVASVLSPLIDDHTISVEGIVPNASGRGNKYKIPCQIHIFAKTEDFEAVKLILSTGRLELFTQSDMAMGLSEAVVVKEQMSGNELKNLDDVFKLVDENLSKKAMVVLEPPKEVIKSELLLHQKEGLGWMVHRENSNELPPFWEEKDGQYVNELTNYRTVNRPEPLCGGILADDMGLGKTLMLISLIAFDKYGRNEGNIEVIGEDDEETFVNKGKRGKSAGKGNVSHKKRKSDDSRLHSNVKQKSVGRLDKCSTLVVCPPSVFSTWITQLGEHTRPGKLKVYLYYGERTKEVQELEKYDIVLTTYTVLSVEASWEDSPVKKIEWWRIILDEAHIIKNANARQSQAVTNLSSKRRWVVTGTPIQNGSFDLFSLMAFLRFEPFSIKSYWQSLVQRPLAQGKRKALSRLQILMATISLRRTKDKALVGLPCKTIESHYIELSVEERNLYNQIEGQVRSLVRDCLDSGGLLRNYSTILSILLRLRQICVDRALCPPDLISLIPSCNMEDVSNNPELLKRMVAQLQDGEDFDCPICISPPTDIVITCCAHIFCRPCILKTLQRTRPCCPLCRRPLVQSDLYSAPPEPVSSENTEVSSPKTVTSSKVSALLELLAASRAKSPTTKSVVFSQFRKMLLLLEEPLKAAGFKILRLDGSMNAKKRAEVIKEFGVPGQDGPTVLLASLKASGAGINLTAASRVYLLEPWWNPAVEEQAMDRVHRIGQKDDVTIVRLIARDSIEERILTMQENKKKLANEAFRRQGLKDRREVTIDDLRALMSL
ncbi:DNA/RNA helicase protein [Tripterygium wilfordii]|uniref:DNA/RNA helicase protein n=1 Tax=Tripterygium wilfordii TaxID=458696 RepID=A0A7J7DVW6_TRIWF|nr:putative SWI/SNF-related matrix-associated actin-dependent regulator of chromatin subfamily A member 3-like 1 [Tripterygium wilfordii]KAF5750304.1 DNA/RNA helicase protein [Tripterygium wilfordii]